MSEGVFGGVATMFRGLVRPSHYKAILPAEFPGGGSPRVGTKLDFLNESIFQKY